MSGCVGSIGAPYTALPGSSIGAPYTALPGGSIWAPYTALPGGLTCTERNNNKFAEADY